jgi:hypothetical protein
MVGGAKKGSSLTWNPSLVVLSLVVFLNYFKPSESFLVPYLTSAKRFSEAQVRCLQLVLEIATVNSHLTRTHIMHHQFGTSVGWDNDSHSPYDCKFCYFGLSI